MPEDQGGHDKAGNRVLMLAPTARDAAMARSILADSGFAAEVFGAFDELAHALEGGAEVVVLMEEFFISKDAGPLLDMLGRQPAWSNLPVIVLSAAKGRHAKAEPVMRSLANVVLLERPARIVPLVSAIRAALAARQRQYEIRDNMEQIKRSAEERDRL
jgi:DNA-binding NtrC family response regulator